MAEDAKSRILDAALEEFALKGKEGARMQAIADRAGINKAMLNYYFTNKRQLYIEAVKQVFNKIATATDESLKSKNTARDFFHTLVREMNQIPMNHPQLFRLIMHGFMDRDNDIIEIFKKQDFKKNLNRRIQKFVDRNELRLKDVGQIIINVMSLNMHARIFHSMIAETSIGYSNREFTKQRIDSIVDLLDHGLFT